MVWWVEKDHPASGPEPASDQKWDLQSHIRFLIAAPQIFFKSRAPKRGRVLQDRLQPGATWLPFSTSNDTYVLLKSQQTGRDHGVREILSEALAIFSRTQS